MSLFMTKLKDHTEVQSNRIIKVSTYDGEVELSNFESKNQFVLDGLERSACHYLGDGPVYVIGPAKISLGDGSYRFPSVKCMADFFCYELDPDSDFDLTTLNVVWFSDELDSNYTDEMESHLKTLDWTAHAIGAYL